MRGTKPVPSKCDAQAHAESYDRPGSAHRLARSTLYNILEKDRAMSCRQTQPIRHRGGPRSSSLVYMQIEGANEESCLLVSCLLRIPLNGHEQPL